MISVITAIDRNELIGDTIKGLPWNYPADLKFFRETTTGHRVVMGRKTFENIGRILPNRENVIASLENMEPVEGATIVNDVEAYIKWLVENTDDETFIIGGAEIYRIAEPYVDKIYLTLINDEHEGDIFFPRYKWEDFEITSKRVNGPLSFFTLERRK